MNGKRKKGVKGRKMYSQIQKLLEDVCRGNHGLESVIRKGKATDIDDCMYMLSFPMIHLTGP